MTENKNAGKFADPLALSKAISKGVEVRRESSSKDWVCVNLRLTSSLLREIETMMQDRPEMSRNSWIIEAIREKIKRKE